MLIYVPINMLLDMLGRAMITCLYFQIYVTILYVLNLLMSQGEDGGESGDDEEEEDGFFVPHGYLSDSEGDHSGDEGTQGQDNQV